MYKILIIDDEEPLREAITILGDWQGLGVDQILEATNGNDGLAKLREHKIDLVLVDMKMPELNGTEFLQIAEQEFPDLLTIVISGYNDFEYTRQAIRSKVVDYLLKPINRADLNLALRKAIDVLEAKRKKESEFINKNITLNMSLPKLKEKIYISIIERSFKNQSNEAFLPLIGADVTGNHFVAGVLRVLNLEKVRRDRFHEDRDLLHFAVTNVINEISDDQFQAFSFLSPKGEREYIAVFTLTGGYAEDASFRALYHMKKVASSLKELFGITIAAGLGQTYGEVIDLAKSYDTAKMSLDGIDLLKIKGAIVASNTDKSVAKDSPSLTSRIPLIRNALESGNMNHAKSILDELIQKWRVAGRFTIGEADRTIHEFIILLSDVASELHVTNERLPMGEDKSLLGLRLLSDFDSFEQFEMLLNDILDGYGAEIGRSLAGDRSSVLGNIKAYIDNHYFENIKISMFTEKYFLSREYLMKLFKGQYGYGIHEYVQKVRMDKAKDLLNDPTLKIQDISERLGYKDKNYFSKAFRNYCQCSPSEYRTLLGDGEK